MKPLDLFKLQRFLASALLCDARLNTVNIVMSGELMEETALKRLPDKTLSAEVLAYITLRNGRKGLGVIVQTPEFSDRNSGVPGMSGDIEIECLLIEDVFLNSSPTSGTLIPVDFATQFIIDITKHWAIDGYGTFIPAANAWKRADEYLPLRAIRLRLKMSVSLGKTPNVGQIAITVNAGVCTLTCANNPAANIFYTTDHSFPANDTAINQQTNPYTAPFAVESGDLILACAYQTDLVQSAVAKLIVP